MISTLHIKNIGIIDEILIDFSKGLNILTGETGAGNQHVAHEKILFEEFMKNIINIHGQNDNQNLLNKENHIKYLDKFLGKEFLNKKLNYTRLYNEYVSINKELKENYGDEKEKQRKLDLLYYQLNEIKNANLKMNEDEELEEQKNLIVNAERISKSLNEADLQINENALNALSIAIKRLERIEDINVKYQKTLSSLKSNYYDLQ